MGMDIASGLGLWSFVTNIFQFEEQDNVEDSWMTFTDLLKGVLDRPGLRVVVLPLVNWLGRRAGGVTKIFYEEGVWIHKTWDGYFPYPQPFLRLDPSIFERATRMNFFWGYKPKVGDVIVDVGAGVGEEALTFSRAVGASGRVICVEANARTYRCLQKLVEYNHLKNVTAIHEAVSDTSGEVVKIEDSRDYLKNRITGRGGAEVPGSTVDAIYQRVGLRHVNFLKMNIEGAERLAIRGMTETLAHTEVICICCHDFLANSTGDDSLRTKSSVRQLLEQTGLHVVERPGGGLPRYIGDQVWGYNQQIVQKAG
jgi:FkbM family methyltransferase